MSEGTRESKEVTLGHLAGSVRVARDSQSRGCEFKPHVGCEQYLKTKE